VTYRPCTAADYILRLDLQPGNILFALGSDLDLVSENVLDQSKVKAHDLLKVRRLDGRPLDNTVPPYVVHPWPLKDSVSLGTPLERIRTIIVDFGAASTFADVNDGKHAFPLTLRPPELVLGIPMLAPAADIWSLGCLVSCEPSFIAFIVIVLQY
jgi:serine/threonine protein kinase